MHDDEHDLVPHLFALLTATLEDGAALAADGQGQAVGKPEQRALADRLRSAAAEITTLADAIVTIIGGE